jgi:hypothetical protein
MVRESGAKFLKKFKGTVCAGLLYVEGPASSKRTRRLASASARRLATTHAAVPPVTAAGCPCFQLKRGMSRRLRMAHRLL